MLNEKYRERQLSVAKMNLAVGRIFGEISLEWYQKEAVCKKMKIAIEEAWNNQRAKDSKRFLPKE